MANIVIFNDKSEDARAFRRTLGAYRVAQALKDAGYTVQVIDWLSSWHKHTLLPILDLTISKDTLWVGFSSTFMVSNRQQPTPRAQMYSQSPVDIDWLFDQIKQRSNAKIVYGGAYAHLYDYDTCIDTYITGYADVSVVAYTDDLRMGKPTPKKIDSLTYPEPSVNAISVDWTDPSFCLLPNEAVPIELARGCIFKCKFCNYPLIGKRKGTYQRPVEQIHDQMLGVYKASGNTRFYFTDDTFNDDQTRLAELHAMFKTLPFRPQFSCFLRLDLIERWPETADLLLDMGLTGCFFGIETINHKSGLAIGKGLEPKRIKQELERLRTLWGSRVLITLGLILGLPYDTESYFQELEAWVSDPSCPADHFSINTLWIGPPAPEGAGQKDGFSEFNLNLDAYGYVRTEKGSNHGGWLLASQAIDSELCERWRKRLYNLVRHRNKVSEFYVQDYQNLGIGLEQIQSQTEQQIHAEYNMSDLLRMRQREYQQRLASYLSHQL